MSFGSAYQTLPDFEYHDPETVEEVLSLLKRYGDDAKVMAGGIGLVALMKERLISPAHVIDIKRVKQLNQTEYSPGGSLSIGALVNLSSLVQNDLLRTRFTALHDAVSSIADPTIRGRATLVGNVCEAIPWVDSPPALIALDATIEILGEQGKARSVRVQDFIRGPVDVDLNSGELVTAIRIPDVPSRSAFEKFAGGSEFGIASVAISVASGKGRKVRMAYGSVASVPSRCAEAEEILEDAASVTSSTIASAAQVASEKVVCVSDVLASEEYRKQIIKVVTTKALGRLFAK